MTKKEIYLVVKSDVHQTFDSMELCGIALKPKDAQKIYSQALKENDVTTKHDGTDNNDYCIGVYKSCTGIYETSSIREAEKLYTSQSS